MLILPQFAPLPVVFSVYPLFIFVVSITLCPSHFVHHTLSITLCQAISVLTCDPRLGWLCFYCEIIDAKVIMHDSRWDIMAYHAQVAGV